MQTNEEWVPTSTRLFRQGFVRELQESGCYILSNATLRAQDLVPKFLEFLDEYDPEQTLNLLVPREALEDESHGWWNGDDCPEVMVKIEQALDELAPDGYHFGANEGDAACFGFWKNEED